MLIFVRCLVAAVSVRCCWLISHQTTASTNYCCFFSSSFYSLYLSISFRHIAHSPSLSASLSLSLCLCHSVSVSPHLSLSLSHSLTHTLTPTLSLSLSRPVFLSVVSRSGAARTVGARYGIAHLGRRRPFDRLASRCNQSGQRGDSWDPFLGDLVFF